MNINSGDTARACRGRLRFHLFIAAGLAALVAPALAAVPSDTLIVREALGIALPRRTVTSVIPRTPLDAWLTGSRTDAPKEGETARAADGTEVTWQRITPDAAGWFPQAPPGERYVAVSRSARHRSPRSVHTRNGCGWIQSSRWRR